MLLKTLYTIIFSLAFLAGDSQPLSKSQRLQYHDGYHSTHSGTAIQSNDGTRRFNRALYGTNTGFRVEAGDLPEFAMYLPGMGGNFKLGISTGNTSKWLTEAKHVSAWYKDGRMEYFIYDSLLGKSACHVQVLPAGDKEAMIVRVSFMNVPDDLKLVWSYGGVTGRRFSRDGDIGADPESVFYLHPENCKDNKYTIKDNSFQLTFGQNNERHITGIVPANSVMKIVDATKQQNPRSLLTSAADTAPAIAGEIDISPNTTFFFLVQSGEADRDSLPLQYDRAYDSLEKKAKRVEVMGPDKFLFNLGSALGIAADAIWEYPTYLHGAVAWRMRLPAWRGAYAADALGWHDRARTHFSSYALSQVTTPLSAPVEMDTALHLARHLEKIGTGMFTSGYICRNPNGDIRPHHYDMNLVFIDQLLNHFNYTGDTAYVKQMWPVIERHLAWEKRNFDTDGDGLYDAYCCIWASDALQYSGGGVTHSSAYNYRAFKTASELASLIGADGSEYKKEAEKILAAINNELWLPESGWYAEYKDLLGEKLVHTVPGLWTIYHALDAKLPDVFQAWQATRYVDTEIPHIPVKAEGLKENNLFVLSTSNWQPYTWSVNNVALAENLHAALAYWQANRPDEAYHLWKSNLIESMYLGASPGGFQQLSFYDAIRGQLYRDFADPVGMAARTLVEGLFGIQPDALQDTLKIAPGFPAKWNYASIKVPDISLAFDRNKKNDTWVVLQKFPKLMHLKLQVRALKTGVEFVKINGKKVQWSRVENSMGDPVLQITAPKDTLYRIEVKWKGDAPSRISFDSVYIAGDSIKFHAGKAAVKSIYDPQLVLADDRIRPSYGNKTTFVQLQQGAFIWWQPVYFKVVNGIEIATSENTVNVKNYSKDTAVHMWVNGQQLDKVDQALLHPGTNHVLLKSNNHMATGEILNWKVNAKPNTNFEKIDLTKYYNEKVTNIFKQNYLSPRPVSPTLQLPTQGIGNWCYPLATAEISDSGLRAQAGTKNEIILPQGIPFSTPGDSNKNNIIFTSQWDNFPGSITIPLSGKSSHAYLLMAGSTNPMQSRMVNGEVRIHYTDGSFQILPLKNPVNWWPIEQDYLNDGYAFTTDGYIPLRYYLKKGIASTTWNEYITIRGFSNRGIDGGAATVLDLPLDINKELKSAVIHTIANDVVIGLMSLTLVRK